jgi:hypothetical protein
MSSRIILPHKGGSNVNPGLSTENLRGQALKHECQARCAGNQNEDQESSDETSALHVNMLRED